MFDDIKSLITETISDAKVQINDLTGDPVSLHLGILVVSDEFKNVMLIKQHQKIMDILKEKLKGEIHAVQLKTMTHDQAKAQGLEF